MNRLKILSIFLCLFLTVLNFSQLFFVQAFPSYATGYNLLDSTTYVSGSLSNLQTHDSHYMVFRSYASSFAVHTLYAHIETIQLGGGVFYVNKIVGGDTNGTVLITSLSNVGRQLWGRFLYPLSGITLIPSNIWAVYYHAWISNSSATAHCDIDIIIRRSDGTIRTVLMTNKANSANNLVTLPQTLVGSHEWTTYAPIDLTDYLEVDYYCEVVKRADGNAYLRVDDGTSPLIQQTGIRNVLLPSEYTCEVEFSGNAGINIWTNFTWTVTSHFTVPNVTTTFRVFNWQIGIYPISGEGYLTDDIGKIDATKTQVIKANPLNFRDDKGNWKIKVRAVRPKAEPFDWYCNLLLFAPIEETFVTVSTITSRSTTTIFINTTQTLTSLVNQTVTSIVATVRTNTTVTNTVSTLATTTVTTNITKSATTTITTYLIKTAQQTIETLSTQVQIILIILIVSIFAAFIIGFLISRRRREEGEEQIEEDIGDRKRRSPFS